MNLKKKLKGFFSLSRKANEGFTLVELIVVIAIMAILAGVAVPAYSGYINKANKAADLQLLGAINTAFGAAVMEELNVSTSSLPDGYANFSIDSKTVTKHNEAFVKYFKGNENATFKVFTGVLVFEDGQFKAAEDATGIQNAVGRFEGSNYTGNVESLTGSVNNLAGMLGDRIAADGVEDLYLNSGFMTEDDYNSFMDKYKLNADSTETEIANATVMYVADKLGGYSAEEIRDLMSTGTVENNFNGLGTIPTAAMMYGMMAGYANSEYNTGNFELNSNPSGVTDVLSDFNALQNSQGFQDYFNDINGDTMAGGMDDLDGFLAAMGVVNSYEGSFDLTDENLFVSDETNALLESILGSQS